MKFKKSLCKYYRLISIYLHFFISYYFLLFYFYELILKKKKYFYELILKKKKYFYELILKKKKYFYELLIFNHFLRIILKKTLSINNIDII